MRSLVKKKLWGGIQKQANKLKNLIQNSYKSDSPSDHDGGAYPSSSSSTVVVSMGWHARRGIFQIQEAEKRKRMGENASWNFCLHPIMGATRAPTRSSHLHGARLRQWQQLDFSKHRHTLHPNGLCHSRTGSGRAWTIRWAQGIPAQSGQCCTGLLFGFQPRETAAWVSEAALLLVWGVIGWCHLFVASFPGTAKLRWSYSHGTHVQNLGEDGTSLARATDFDFHSSLVSHMAHRAYQRSGGPVCEGSCEERDRKKQPSEVDNASSHFILLLFFRVFLGFLPHFRVLFIVC